MKVPVPNDWNGQAWTCVQIQWPNSPDWLAVLAGLVSQPLRLRFWDEKTGVLLEIQPTAYEILKRNLPWRTCQGEDLALGAGEVNAIGACYECDWEDAMACIDISSMLKIEGGVLYALDNCCNWVAVGAIAGASEDVGETPLDISGGVDPPTYSSCGKAAALVTMISNIITAAWAQLDEPPWQWISHIESGVGYDLDNSHLFVLMDHVIVLNTLGVEMAEILDPFKLAQVRCELENRFDADAAGVPTSGDFEAIKTLFESSGGFFYKEVYREAVDALGRVDMDAVVKLGATNTTADCDCPDQSYLQSYGPDGAGWYLSTPITEGQLTNTNTEAANLATCFEQTPTHDVYGVAYKLTWAGLAAGAHLKKMGSTYSPSCAPTDAWCWGDSSDHLQEAAANTWLMVANGQTIKDAISALLSGQAVSQIYSDSSFFSSVIATPGSGAAGQDLAGVFVLPTVETGGTLTITEIRWVQNTNSPSHA